MDWSTPIDSQLASADVTLSQESLDQLLKSSPGVTVNPADMTQQTVATTSGPRAAGGGGAWR
jgi:hypothetical protein